MMTENELRTQVHVFLLSAERGLRGLRSREEIEQGIGDLVISAFESGKREAMVANTGGGCKDLEWLQNSFVNAAGENTVKERENEIGMLLIRAFELGKQSQPSSEFWMQWTVETREGIASWMRALARDSAARLRSGHYRGMARLSKEIELLSTAARELSGALGFPMEDEDEHEDGGG